MTDEQIDAIVEREIGFDGDGTQSVNREELRRVVRAATQWISSEPQTVLTPPRHPADYIWTALELAAIKAYGERCWCAGRSTGAPASAAAPQEPVAWRSRLNPETRWTLTVHQPRYTTMIPGEEIEPLYLHPPVEAAAPLTFRDLRIGQRFKFFEGGSLLTKSGNRRYDAPQWGQRDNTATDLDQSVIVEAECRASSGSPSEAEDDARQAFGELLQEMVSSHANWLRGYKRGNETSEALRAEFHAFYDRVLSAWQARASLASSASPQDYRLATAEETQAVDDALGLSELPPIRLLRGVFDVIEAEAKACGMVTQSYVRSILSKWVDTSASRTEPSEQLRAAAQELSNWSWSLITLERPAQTYLQSLIDNLRAALRSIPPVEVKS